MICFGKSNIWYCNFWLISGVCISIITTIILFILIIPRNVSKNRDNPEIDLCDQIISKLWTVNKNFVYDDDDDACIENENQFKNEMYNVESDKKYKWPNNKVIYRIDEKEFDNSAITLIKEAIAKVQNQICVTFHEATDDDKHFVFVTRKSTSCSADVGYLGWTGRNPQLINLGGGCMRLGIIMHEISHALGIDHMQNYRCRDKYIKICWDNIKPSHKNNFKKREGSIAYGLPYDYGSIMHYRFNQFGIDRQKPTLVPLYNRSAILGQRDGFSKIDVQKLKYRYNCEPSVVIPPEEKC